jgi:hypothetical protein
MPLLGLNSDYSINGACQSEPRDQRLTIRDHLINF